MLCYEELMDVGMFLEDTMIRKGGSLGPPCYTPPQMHTSVRCNNVGINTTGIGLVTDYEKVAISGGV